MAEQQRIPVSILTGAIDRAVFVAEIMETTSGCLCCTGRGNFVQLLNLLLDNRSRFDYLIVETDGLADPTFVNVFFENERLRDAMFLDGIVTLVDAKNILRQLDQPRPPGALNEAYEQIAVADRILINKTDLATPEEVDQVESRIRAINSAALVRRSQFSQVDLDFVLDIKAFDLNRVLHYDPRFLEMRPDRRHDPDIGTFCIVSADPLPELDAFRRWLERTLKEQAGIVRSKGVLFLKDNPNRYVFQGVHQAFEVREHKPWPQPNPALPPDQQPPPPLTRLVFIGRNLDKPTMLRTFQEETRVAAREELPPQTGIARRPSFLNLAILFSVTVVLFSPDEVLASLAKLPLYEYTRYLILYRWYLLLAWVIYYVFLSRRQSPNQTVRKV